MAKRAKPTGEGRRIALLARTTPQLRAKLEKAASVSGRSLGQEVEHRLEESFLRAQASPAAQYLGDVVALSATFSSGITGVSPIAPKPAARRYTLVRATMAMALVMDVKPLDEIEDEEDRKLAIMAETFAKEDEAAYRAAYRRWDENLGSLADLFRNMNLAPPDRSVLGKAMGDHAPEKAADAPNDPDAA